MKLRTGAPPPNMSNFVMEAILIATFKTNLYWIRPTIAKIENQVKRTSTQCAAWGINKLKYHVRATVTIGFLRPTHRMVFCMDALNRSHRIHSPSDSRRNGKSQAQACKLIA
jgi:hypothetical protein